MKSGNYPEYLALLRAAERLGRPVRWVSTRSEAFLTDNQGRGSDRTAELALEAQARFLALRVKGLADLGAYLTQAAAFVPTGLVMMWWRRRRAGGCAGSGWPASSRMPA